MRIDRLNTIINLLKTLPEERFDLDYWYGRDNVESADGWILTAMQHPAEALAKCGTTACVAGWASTLPDFPRSNYPPASLEIRDSFQEYLDCDHYLAEDIMGLYHEEGDGSYQPFYADTSLPTVIARLEQLVEEIG
jgi:hypothetical protein